MKGFSLIQQIGFWFFLLFSMIAITQSELTLPGAIQRSLIMAGAYAVNFYMCFLVLTPRYFERKRYTEFIIYMIMLYAFLTAFRYNIDLRFPHRLINTAGKRLVVIMLTNITVSSFSVMLRLSLSRLDYERKYLEKEKEQISTELLLLKSQIHPHFLFNTLNNLYTLILQGSDKAGDALMRLSDLLRYLLYECEQPKVPLRKEMDALRSFIALHQLKYERPINIILTEQNVNERVMIEPMLLIPLIENAFKYSDVGINEDACIKLEFVASEKQINIEISNTAEQGQVPASDVGGIGLRNVRRRLELSYGSGFKFEITDKGNFFTVRLEIPIL
jgi:two-component system LytT family sensor kinase